ncbi:MAG: hypothetical protein KME46_33525 [Brasilonema angustatum HA4187-MV1]|jgi:hypothetical protein|nr:hypothetical protein [Brasilonema angustatum HA4187-MV1]
MIKDLLFYLSIFFGYRTERVVNIVWRLDDPDETGYSTNSVFRANDYRHERDLLSKNTSTIETSAAIASPLTCQLDRMSYEHGCYTVF